MIRTEKIFKEIAKHFLNLMKNINLKIPEAQQHQERKEKFLNSVIVKLLKTKSKEKNLESSREKNYRLLFQI